MKITTLPVHTTRSERDGIEGKWPMRRTLIFVAVSSVVLWAVIIAVVV